MALHGGARLRVMAVEQHVGGGNRPRAGDHDLIAPDQAAAREPFDRLLDEPGGVRCAAVRELDGKAAKTRGRERRIDLRRRADPVERELLLGKVRPVEALATAVPGADLHHRNGNGAQPRRRLAHRRRRFDEQAGTGGQGRRQHQRVVGELLAGREPHAAAH